MKKILFLVLILVFCSNLVSQKKIQVLPSKKSTIAHNSEVRKIFNLNTQWAFHRGEVPGGEKVAYNDAAWFAVSLPHSMRLEKKHNGGDHIFQGVGWYRRYFTLDPKYKNRRIVIDFEGVQMNCEIYLNGAKISEHHGGYLGFLVDISDKIRFGQKNVLALRVSSENDPMTPPGKPQSGLDFYYYGGIYRNVNLLITDKLHISDTLQANKIAGGGLFVTFPEVNQKEAKINVKTQLKNLYSKSVQFTLVTSVISPEGKEITQSSIITRVQKETELVQNYSIKQPKLWHPDHPFLYNIRSQIFDENRQLVDELFTSIGIRHFSFKSPMGKADGFYLNGEKLYLRGANRHQSYQYIGDAASNSMQYRDALLIKQGGFNAVRATHYPQSPAFLDACDQLGLLVIECIPGWQYFNKDRIFVERTYENIRQMIRRDRNRPSVFLWETSLNESPASASWAKEAVRIAHEEMPNNQMFTSDDYFAKGKYFYDVSYKVINEDATDPDPNMPSLTREWGDTWIANPAEENGLRASRKYTSKGLINQTLLRQNALNGSMLEEEGAYWDHAKLDANKRISGYFLWSFNDYTRGTDSITAFSGVVDMDRYPKFGYFQLKAMQNARNKTYGPMVFIASYNNRPDLDSKITVFSNADAVNFYRNSKFIKTISRAENAKTAPYIADKGGSPYFTFELGTYEAGELKADALMDGRVVATHLVKTPETPEHLLIELADMGIKPIADGSDMLGFYIYVCDKNGTVISNKKANETFNIQIKVEGAAELIGENSPRIGVNPQKTEGGIGYGILKMKPQAGIVKITATSPGLKPKVYSFNTLKYTGKYLADAQHPIWKKEIEKPSATITSSVKKDLRKIKLSTSQLKLNFSNTKDVQKLFDGAERSIWITDSQKLPLEFTWDLGEPTYIVGNKIVWGKDSDWYTYSIWGATDTNRWQELVQVRKISGQDYKPVVFQPKKVRFLKLIISDVQPEKSKPAIGEIEFYTEN